MQVVAIVSNKNCSTGFIAEVQTSRRKTRRFKASPSPTTLGHWDIHTPKPMTVDRDFNPIGEVSPVFEPGDYITLQFGRGTQIARIEAHRSDMRFVIRRYNKSRKKWGNPQLLSKTDYRILGAAKKPD